MLEELCHELNNWFDENPKDGTKRHYFGEFTIENGALDLSEIGIQTGQYFRIVGSVFNDGVYQYPADGLADEIFDGAVWAMAIPPTVIALSQEIQEWRDEYDGVEGANMAPYNSESFGGYSYSKGGYGSSSSAKNRGNGAPTWQSMFINELNNWRKI